MATLQIPKFSVIALVGASSAGKTSFAARHFDGETLSSDAFRALVSGDENDLGATADAFESLYFVAGKRLERGLLTVIDATSVRPGDRRRIVELARQHDTVPCAIVLDLPLDVLQARHAARPDRHFDPGVVARQRTELRRTLGGLQKEGFRHVWVLSSEDEVAATLIECVPLYPDRRDLTGPFDFIGDVHGCLAELEELLLRLGYRPEEGWTHPEGRTAVFVGDLVDRGPDSVGTLRLVMQMVASGAALAVPGNHDEKLKQALEGRAVQARHGLDRTLEDLRQAGPEFSAEVAQFIRSLVSHLVLDGGRAVVAHAGLPAHLQGRASGRVRSFALYGDVDGSLDEAGFPVRRDWAQSYQGKALVVYGHTPVPEPRWVHHTVNIDTGCAFGGALTALRYPELETVSVPARAQYAVPARPLHEPLTAPETSFDQATWLTDYSLQTRTLGRVRVTAAEAGAALAAYSRGSIDPRLCLYLPPTMSPVATSAAPDLLEEPQAAFDFYRAAGCTSVICQEKHMGSRAVLLICREPQAALQRFGVETLGAVYTRTGRAFFQPEWEQAVLTRARDAVSAAQLWERLDTDWVLLDAEILPWNFKAADLLSGQYAPVGAAGLADLGAAQAALEQARANGVEVGDWLTRTQARHAELLGYRSAYRAYVGPVAAPGDLRVMPFYLLASQGQVHTQDHLWHLSELGRLAAADPGLFGETAYQVVNLTDPQSMAAAAQWWHMRTQAGSEGMVVKPLDAELAAKLQPALKVRGRDYLRLIYGPEYLLHLPELRERALAAKRSRALREYHLGLEGLSRAAEGRPWPEIHECVLGVLALESGALDARL
ncbi:polynucleotide kinase-phosphatase [Deinococcus lacus]|uniref:Polynucleotide kinase-phosphatase n=1 Tax=Deinococcus lacus TaxID=392561 RepID=A0ABW1YEF1_9DEIO